MYVESTGLNVLNSIPYSMNFGRGKPWRIGQITGGSPNFAIQTLTMSCDMQISTIVYSPKVSDEKFAKNLHYLV